MANTRYYNATKEDSRSWRASHDSAADAADQASQSHANQLETDTRATNPVTSMTLSPSSKSISLGAGETVHLIPKPKVSGTDYPDGVAVTWTSSAPSKATVDFDGVVTPVATGSATITATAIHNNSITATASITVTA